jgi:hypothetical protein
MSQEELKKVGTEVSNECLKKLKILAIQREVTLAAQVREILERSVSKKTFETFGE